jgi:hypothetical protein
MALTALLAVAAALAALALSLSRDGKSDERGWPAWRLSGDDVALSWEPDVHFLAQRLAADWRAHRAAKAEPAQAIMPSAPPCVALDVTRLSCALAPSGCLSARLRCDALRCADALGGGGEATCLSLSVNGSADVISAHSLRITPPAATAAESDAAASVASVTPPPAASTPMLERTASLGSATLTAATGLSRTISALRRVFVTQELSPRGRYTLRLWDEPCKSWRDVTVSDEIPCDATTRAPLFTKPNGNELWVLLLEKAFAKFVGSYANLESGHMLWALQVLTGNHVCKFMAQDAAGDEWRRYNLQCLGTPGDAAGRRKIGLPASDEIHPSAEMFDLLRTYAARRSVIGASSVAGKDTAAGAAHGIVQGHAYAILRVLDVR